MTGEAIEVPAAALRALKLVAEGISGGLALSLIPLRQGADYPGGRRPAAADLLHVSRPHLVKLLEEDRIRHHRVGTHRRVRLEDILAFTAERTERRREELCELTRLVAGGRGGYV